MKFMNSVQLKKTILILLFIVFSFAGIGKESRIMLMTPNKSDLNKFTIISTSKEKVLFVIAKEVQVYKENNLLYLIFLNGSIHNQFIGKDNVDSSHFEVYSLGLPPRTHITVDGGKLKVDDLLKKFPAYKGAKIRANKNTTITTIATDLDSYSEMLDGDETLEDVAKRHSIDLKKLKELNPRINVREKIKKGTYVVIQRF